MLSKNVLLIFVVSKFHMMATENKKVQTTDYEQSYKELHAKNKIRKSINANEKSIAEFCIALTLTIMYFRMLAFKNLFSGRIA